MTDHVANAQTALIAAQAAIAVAQTELAMVQPPAPDVVTDRQPRALPGLPAIAKGGVIADPTFGSRILRLTDLNSDPTTPVSFRSSDSTIQRSWNATSTRLTIEDTYARQIVYEFNGANLSARLLKRLRFSPARRRQKTIETIIVPFNGSDCAWHDTDPDRIYGRYGNRILKVYDFADDSFTTVLDLDTLGLDLPDDTYTGGVCVMNNTIMTVCGGSVNDYNHIVVVMPLPSGEVRTLDTLDLVQFNEGQGFYLHSTTMDLTGRYILMVPSELSGDKYHLYIWDLETDSVVLVDTATSGHCALGRAHWVNQDCKPGTVWDAAQWTKRAFGTPNTVDNCISPTLTPTEVYLAEHPSWTNMQDASTPFVTATYRYSVSDVPWRAWDEEVITVNPAGGEVRRQCHHRSQVLTADGVWDYWATPRPNISVDGKWALFTSNWGRTLGTDAVEGGARQDAFVVELR